MSFINTLRKAVMPFAAASTIVLSTSPIAMAATDGDPARASDGGSVGTTDMTMSVPKLIRITGMSDIAITEQEVIDAINSGTPHTESVDACVGGNGTFTYGITITSSTSAYQLDPDDGSGNPAVPFNVTWKTAATTHNTAVTGQTLDRENLGTAACANTGNLAVAVSNTDLFAARSGSYANTLTLTVEPE